jgi:hypothetical protein
MGTEGQAKDDGAWREESATELCMDSGIRIPTFNHHDLICLIFANGPMADPLGN